MVIKMLTELGRRMNEHSENLNKKIENIRKVQTEVIELKTIVGEPKKKKKKTLQGFNCRLEEAEERISELKDRTTKLTQSE